MKEQDYRLTYEETEELCKLYVDCRLSVLEERELQYVLTQVDYHSPLIDEAREMMGIELAFSAQSPAAKSAQSPEAKSAQSPEARGVKKRQPWLRRVVYSGIAASIALLIGVSVYHGLSGSHISSEPYYLAYADGRQLSDEDAKVQIEAEMQSAEAFMSEMAQFEAEEKMMMENFSTINTVDK